MARALQTNAWIAFGNEGRPPLFYSKEFIRECLTEVKCQTDSWKAYFDRRGVKPLWVDYEDLLADKALVVQSIAKHLGVEMTSLRA